MLKLFLGCSWKILNSLAAESRFNDLHRSECFPPTTFLLLERIRKLAPFVAFFVLMLHQHYNIFSKPSRPRINKLNSQKDSEQKRKGEYFFYEEEWKTFLTVDVVLYFFHFAFARSQVNCSSGERLCFAWPNKISSDSLDPNGVGLP